jgi:hypothetical protein
MLSILSCGVDVVVVYILCLVGLRRPVSDDIYVSGGDQLPVITVKSEFLVHARDYVHI